MFFSTLAAIAAIGAVCAAGVPTRAWSAKRLPLLWEVARRDLLLFRGGLPLAVAIALLAAAGVWGQPGAMIVLALVAAGGVPLALQRWEFTNGCRSPLTVLLRQARATSGPAAAGPGERRAVSDALDALPAKLVAQLQRLADAERPEWIARALATRALWTDRYGRIVWGDASTEGQRRRTALERLLEADPYVVAHELARRP